MLDNVKKMGLEKFAGDESKADQFVEGFVAELQKVASTGIGGLDLSKVKNVTISLPKGPFNEFVGGIAGGFGKGIAGMGTNLLVTGALAGLRQLDHNSLERKFHEALANAIAATPLLREEGNKEKAISYANTIFRFAPNVATDKNLLSTVLANAVQGDLLDPATLKSLTDLEGRISDNSAFSPKNYV